MRYNLITMEGVMEKAAILHFMDQNYCFVNAKGEYVF